MCILDLLVRTKTMSVIMERHDLISLVSRLGLSGSVSRAANIFRVYTGGSFWRKEGKKDSRSQDMRD